MNKPRKLHIKSFGCQMNVYDSGRMAELLAEHGYEETAEAADADLVILNTCHIREKAAEKVYSDLGRLRRMKDEAGADGREVTIAVAGCVAQAEGEEIIRRQPAVNLVVGPQSYHRLPELLAGRAGGGPRVDLDFPADEKFTVLAGARAAARPRGVSAFVTVQEGCDKFCTFCVVPYTRGGEFSRAVPAIVAEVERLAAAGVREVTLIGQNVNAFHGAGTDGREATFGTLLRAVAAVPGIARVRYTTSHPRDVDQSLIDAHRDLDALMPFLHLPVQSGSDRILAAMNRKHTRADYFAIVEKLRRARPDLALSSDFIVGFPGETEQDFEDTLDLIRQVGFASSFSFKYSARPGTPAADMPDQLPETVKTERLLRLQDLLEQQRRSAYAACLHGAYDVLFEKPGRYPGQIVGRLPTMQTVQVDGPASLIGETARTRIVEVAANSLFGVLEAPAAARNAPAVPAHA